MLFFPDQHLGRNTGIAMGYGHDDMRVWNPRFELGGLTEADCKEATFLLWKGHCSVHQRFRPEHVDAFRAEHPDGIVVVHPECRHDVVRSWPTRSARPTSSSGPSRPRRRARSSASAPRSTSCNRLDDETPDKTVVSLDPLICPCSTMFRIDAAHLCWVLENLVDGQRA